MTPSFVRTILVGAFWFGLLALPFIGLRSSLLLMAALLLGGIVWRALLILGRGNHPLALLRRIPSGLYSLFSSFQQIDRTLRFGLVLVVLGVVPLFLTDYLLDILSLASLYALLSVGLYITVGLTGLFDLGYAAFYGIGAYTYALLSTQQGLSFWWSLPLGGAVSAFFGLLLGMITLRLQGDYLAIVTLGFVQIVYLILNNWDALTDGPNGILNIAPPFLAGVPLHRPIQIYYLFLFFLILVAGMVHRLTTAPIGRAFAAIREDSLAAEAMGIDTTRMKIFAFVLGAAVAGIAGVLFAAKYTFVSPESFNFFESVRILTMVVLGGMGSLWGAIGGAILLTVLPELLRGLESYRMLIFGLILVGVMIVRPQGLWGKRPLQS